MTKRYENFELTNNYSADSSSDGVQLSSISQGKASDLQSSLAARNQSDLVERRVIPDVRIENSNTKTSGDWASARVEARRESEKNIGQGKHIHHIRYGDTLWDIASASYAKNNGQKASNREIMGEVNRLAKKNNVSDMNNIPIGTALDTAPDRTSGNAQVRDRANERLTPRQLDRIPNYYDSNGGQRRTGPNQNYYDFTGGPTRQNEIRLPDISDRRPGYSGRQPNSPYQLPTPGERRLAPDVPATPTRTHEPQDRREGPTFGPRSINPSMEITARQKTTTTWRNAHSELVAKARRGAPSVAFYGDSITQGLQLNPGFKSSFGGSENFGVGGDTNENLLYRLKDGEANFPGTKPDTAVLLIGTNNIGSHSPDKIAAGILANARELSNRMPGTEIVVMGILPRGYSANDPLRRQVNTVNDMVRRQLDGVAGVKFVDIGPQLLDGSGNMRAGIFQRDNVHLSYTTGYSAMLNALKPHVRSRR